MREEHLSPDGALRLVTIRATGDVTLGFHGRPWHTHGDVLAGELELAGQPKCTPKEAAKRWVDDVFSGAIPIAVVRRAGRVQDAWATYLPETDDPQRPEEEQLELRRWDGTPWEASEHVAAGPRWRPPRSRLRVP